MAHGKPPTTAMWSIVKRRLSATWRSTFLATIVMTVLSAHQTLPFFLRTVLAGNTPLAIDMGLADPAPTMLFLHRDQPPSSTMRTDGRHVSTTITTMTTAALDIATSPLQVPTPSRATATPGGRPKTSLLSTSLVQPRHGHAVDAGGAVISSTCYGHVGDPGATLD